ncbi:hypothetical protein [Cellulomonas dongxiuzhuiae]|uniref:Uncharacterized protein n=1 Tax=Cellulomonas dongxiuzhuiae TaxID=2819979 RepID=A0ABX8GK21_9CELL|nr:hypothetical protein [Cellulomonas dongxiuzhuiae]MBO3095557.1 hypothetical protein [Cellulomonas dongxiuzhuiae]QWC16529.1 hypothetical protein KKR89_02330 [Cellulomonas dongxiuzhuiae]
MTTGDPPETMSSAMVPHFRLLAATIGDWLSDQDFDARPDCPAAVDMANRQWDDTWGDPTVELVMDAIPRLAHVADHLHAYAAIAADEHATFSGATILRTMLVSLGSVYWQYELTVDTRERIRRFYALRLKSLAEEQNLVAVPGLSGGAESLGQLAGTVDAIRESGERAGFRWEQRTSRFGASVGQLDSPAPSDQALIAGLVESPGSSLGVGATLFRLFSAVAHAQPHGMRFFMHQTDEAGPNGGELVFIGLDPGWVTMLHTTAVSAIHRTVTGICGYLGWDQAEWNRIAAPALMEARSWPT